MNSYEESILTTIEFCNLIIANKGRQGINAEKLLQTEKMKEQYMSHLENYRELSINREKVPAKDTRTFSR